MQVRAVLLSRISCDDEIMWQNELEKKILHDLSRGYHNAYYK